MSLFWMSIPVLTTVISAPLSTSNPPTPNNTSNTIAHFYQRSIRYSLTTRGCHICNHPDDLHTYTSNLSTRAFSSHGYPAPLVHKQLFCGLHHPIPSHPLSLITTYCPGPHLLKRILREDFHILSLDPSTQDLLTKPSSVTFRKPPNLRQLIVDTSLRPTELLPVQAPDLEIDTDVRPAPFTSSHTNVTFPITTHADCKSMNLIYQLQCTECNAFHTGETRHSLSDHTNGHWFTTTISNQDLPGAIHTQSHQIPFQKMLVSQCHTQTTRLHPRPHPPPI